MKYIITNNKKILKKFQRCIKEHPNSIDRMNNGVYCLKCLYTIINGVLEPL